MHKIRWDDLQFIHAVARTGSLSGAARTLGVNHATVLRRIEAVEASVGARLFERPPGGYRLRAEARDILSGLETMARSAEQLGRMLPLIGRGVEGAVRVTTTDSLADLILPRHIAGLAAAYPALKVELIVSNAVMSVAAPDAEVSVRPAMTAPEGLTSEHAALMTFGAYARPDLGAAPWVGLAPPLTRSPIGRWQETLPDEAIGPRADSFLSVARMAEAGLGRAMIPDFIGRASDILLPLEEAPRFETSIWVAAHPDFAGVERIAAVVRFLIAAMAADERLARAPFPKAAPSPI